MCFTTCATIIPFWRRCSIPGGKTAPKKCAFLQGGDAALHNPFSMSGMAQAVARIRRAIKQQEKIAIYGDFDADGVTSTALLTQALEALGGPVRPYIPDRVDEGYGLNLEALRWLHEQGVKLVITVDCGIRSVDEVELRHTLGLDMIVTDHHSVGDQIPDALAVINPKIDEKIRPKRADAMSTPKICWPAWALPTSWPMRCSARKNSSAAQAEF